MTTYGPGVRAVARRLGVSPNPVRQWERTFRSVGREGLLDVGHKGSYGWDAKVAAASAVVDSGRAKLGVTRGLGIASGSPLDAWRRRCREGGAEAPRPRPKGGPKGAGASRTTRERRLEREVAKLKARVAYLKIDSPEGGEALSSRERAAAVSELSGRCGLSGPPERAGLARDFASDGPWRKMGTDAAEFRRSFGKACLAPACDFGSREVAAWSISESPGRRGGRRRSTC